MTQAKQVKFKSIAKDEWEAGDYVECAECNAPLRHYVVIDGVSYGRDCGARNLGYTTVKKMEKEVLKRIRTWDVIEAFVKNNVEKHGDNWDNWQEDNIASYAIWELATEYGYDWKWNDCYLAALIHDQLLSTEYAQ